MLRGDPATWPPISPTRRARGAASTAIGSCYYGRIEGVVGFKMGVAGILQIADSNDDGIREEFDGLWWYVDGFGCGGSSLVASTVGGLRSEETPTAQSLKPLCHCTQSPPALAKKVRKLSSIAAS